MKIKHSNIALLSASIFLMACQAPAPNEAETKAEEITTESVEEAIVYNTNDVSSILKSIEMANGGMENLKALKNVEYEYHYLSPDDTKDISLERYIFDGEISWAKYTTHEKNVPATLVGDVVQLYDGENIMVSDSMGPIENPEIVGGGQFLRQANLMWFCMMFKLSDPGTISEYQGQKEQNGKMYDLVHLSYDSSITGKAENDIFVLYVNPETHLVDYFNFSLPAFGVHEPVLWAELSYEEIDGIQVVVHRMMYGPNPETGEMAVMVDQQLKNVSFNNDFNKETLVAEI